MYENKAIGDRFPLVQVTSPGLLRPVNPNSSTNRNQLLRVTTFCFSWEGSSPIKHLLTCSTPGVQPLELPKNSTLDSMLESDPSFLSLLRRPYLQLDLKSAHWRLGESPPTLRLCFKFLPVQLIASTCPLGGPSRV